MELSYEIGDYLTKGLKALDLKVAAQAAMIGNLDSEVIAGMLRQARISTIGATTRIENAVLTDAEIDWVDTELEIDGRPTAFVEKRSAIEAKLSRDKERSIEEVAGCREMLQLIFSQASDLFPLSHGALCGLHRQLLKYHSPASFHLGRYKKVPNTVVERNDVTGEERPVLKTSDPGPITESTMADLIDWYNQTLPEHPWPIAVASELVFRFLACHPFQDGNGRLGRALFMLAMMQAPDENLNLITPFLAVDRAIEQSRVEYYAVLARVSGGGFHLEAKSYKIELFLSYMLKVLDKALAGIDYYRDRVQAMRDLSPASDMIIQCFRERPEQRLTPRQIRSLTDIALRTVSRNLASLVANGFLQRLGKGAGTRYQLVF